MFLYLMILYISNVFCLITVTADAPLLNGLPQNPDYKQESEGSNKLQPFPTVYSTIPWFDQVTEPRKTKKNSANFSSSMRDHNDISATKNGPCLEKKSTISFSVESIIGTKWYEMNDYYVYTRLHFITVNNNYLHGFVKSY